MPRRGSRVQVSSPAPDFSLSPSSVPSQAITTAPKPEKRETSMRHNRIRQFAWLLFLTAFAFFTLAAEAQAKGSRSKAPPRAKTITGTGCVEAGVEGGCLVLTDTKTKTVYNLYFRGRSKPSVGTAIRFTGTTHSGPTICQQGQPVNVQKWTVLKMRCPIK